jgi:hypothetical protein
MRTVINEPGYIDRTRRSDADDRPSKIYALSALVGFVMLVPGFAVYQIGLYQGWIAPFLGGYLGIAGVLTSLLMIPVLVWSYMAQVNRFNASDFFFFLFILIFSLVALYATGDVSSSENAISKLSTAPLIVAYFAVFRLMNVNSRITMVVTGLSLAICAFVMYFLSLGIYDADQSAINIIDTDGDSLANYQFFGMIYLICFIVILPIVTNQIVRYIIYLFSIYVLYINGARSEFAMLLFAIGIIELWISPARARLFLVLSFVFLFVGVQINNLASSDIEQGRITSLLVDGTRDASYVDRGFALSGAIDTVLENPLIGKFGDHELGFYAHNIISAWADFGIGGFAVFMLGLAVTIQNAMRSYSGKNPPPQAISAAAFAFTGTALFCFAKAYSHPYFGVMMAASAQFAQIHAMQHLAQRNRKLSHASRLVTNGRYAS